jgi:hypothetical protein
MIVQSNFICIWHWCLKEPFDAPAKEEIHRQTIIRNEGGGVGFMLYPLKQKIFFTLNKNPIFFGQDIFYYIIWRQNLKKNNKKQPLP